MTSFDDLAEKYALTLRRAAISDQTRGLLESTGDWTRSELARAILEVSEAIKGVRYTDTRELLADDDREFLVNQVAEKLGYKKPEWLRHLLEERSLDALMTMCQQIEHLYHSLRK